MKTITIWKLSMLLSATVLVVACNDGSKATGTAPITLDFDDVKTKDSYAIGMGAGKSMRANLNSVKDAGIELDLDILAQAFIDGIKETSQLDDETVAANMNDFRQRIGEAMKIKRAAEAKEQELVAEENKVKGAEFLAANKVKEGVITTESGLQYKILKAGSGKSPTATDKVKVHYTGTLTDGTKFDSSRDRGEPSSFGVNRVIKGCTEALQLMQEGSQWELYIPADIAYGATSRPKIPGNSVLIFDVELIEVTSAPQAPAKKPAAAK